MKATTMLFDLPLEELYEYRPEVTEPGDFDAFWAEHLGRHKSLPLSQTFDRVDAGLQLVEVFDVTYAGYGGDEVKGWLLIPADVDHPIPAVVEFLGYGAGRGMPHERLLWSTAGYAHLIMDTRGQGWAGTQSHTANPDTGPPGILGFLASGIRAPTDFYYLRVFIDALRAVEVAANHELVDAERIGVTGASQGGGIALAVAGLAYSPVVVMADVPFLAHFRRALEITDAAPYSELAGYFRNYREDIELGFETLSYFDGVNHAKRAQAAGLFSVALADQVCPPSTVFAAYNWYAGPKDLRVYPYNGHEGGGSHHVGEKLQFARSHLKSPA